MSGKGFMLFAPLLALLVRWDGASAQPAPAPEVLRGHVVSEDGEPISRALVIHSSGGIASSCGTAADGHFELSGRGAFLSVRHDDYRPVLIKIGENQDYVNILLKPSDESIWRVPSCGSVPGGGGLG